MSSLDEAINLIRRMVERDNQIETWRSKGERTECPCELCHEGRSQLVGYDLVRAAKEPEPVIYRGEDNETLSEENITPWHGLDPEVERRLREAKVC